MILSIIVRTSADPIAPLFRSEAQARLLAELFLASDGELSLSELSERTGTAYGSTHREIERLLQVGLLQERRVGRARLVRPNPASPLTSPVRSLVMVAAGPVPLLTRELGSLSGIDIALVFGSYAARSRGIDGPPPEDIDVMVVGQPDAEAVYAACRSVGEAVGRPVNPVIMTPDEWQADSGFLTNLRSSPTIPLIGAGEWPSRH
ncbi:ArsR family transcriptional regulator [Nocardioides sp. W7]|uniref:ArsR family transcriptional regulator n=1 Tax=Nocardioides sp. W7 TaxID=2931390 RepID=UPI001FD3CE85|nr:ArsR family transcriptional regulator [Nocardioides sp. W7]